MTETPIFDEVVESMHEYATSPPAPYQPRMRNHKVINGRRIGTMLHETMEKFVTDLEALRIVDSLTDLQEAITKNVRWGLEHAAFKRRMHKARLRRENRSPAANRTRSKKVLAGSRRNKKHRIARTPTLRDRGWEIDWDACSHY